MNKKIPDIYLKNLEHRDVMKEAHNIPSIYNGDPVHTIAPFNFEIFVLSKESGFDEINICYRVIEIMESLKSPDEWSEESENKLRQILESSSLKFTFNKIRPSLVHLAIYHVVAELIDLNILNFESLMKIDYFFRKHDSNLVYIEPTERPLFIEKMDVDKVNNNSFSFEKIKFECDNKFILGENTTLINYFNRDRITEIRKSKVFIKSNDFHVNEKEPFFEKLHSRYIHEYLDLNILNEKSIPLLIKNEFRGYFSKKGNWLALNPEIGFQLDWYLDDSGLFRWVNEENKIMVESIFWKDGLTDSFEHFDEVGEGWFVVASKSAFNSIIKNHGPIEQEQYICSYKNDEYYRKTFKFNKKSVK